MQIAEKKWFVNLGSHMISSQSFWLWKENVWCHIVLCLKERIDWKTKNYLFDLFRDPSDSVCVLTLTINIIRTRDGISPIVTIAEGTSVLNGALIFDSKSSPVHGDKGGLNLPDACSNMCTGHSLRWLSCQESLKAIRKSN